MNEFGDKHIAWYNDTASLENELEDVDLYHTVDYHTIIWRNLALKIMELNLDERKRLVSAHEIVPHAISLQNRCKGGHDVVSLQLQMKKYRF